MALACEAAGASKAGRDAIGLVVLGLLAGAFIAVGAVFMTIVLTGAEDLPWGVARLLAGLVFSLGLVLVIVGGAELFTGDSLMIVACASRRITIGALLRAWSLVYVGNIAGAMGTAPLVVLAGQHEFASAVAACNFFITASGADNGVWQVAGGTGRWEKLKGAGTFRLRFPGPTDRLFVMEGEFGQY